MRTRFTRGLSAALVVSSLALSAAACGGDDKKDDAKKDGADKPAASASASAAPEAAAPAKPLTDAQMKAAALELKDLPSGWKTTKTDDDKSVYKADKAECEPVVAVMNDSLAGATKGPSADFAIGNNDSELSQQIVTFTGTGAADFTKKLAAAVDACASFSVETDGQKMKVGAKKATAPQGAEEAVAFTFALEVAPNITVEPTLLVARQGAGLFRLMYLADDAAAKKNFDALAKTATDKFVKAAQG
ncbi:hypothetical protein AB0C52_16735 [Streptomyces sp. NPDC048717]|uniref:hypothetical protein n=1 Tax=Streptomyces sp. NPDC048717 TaxID=3154928 RepID=UPI00342F3B3B